nr:hypothetical protein Itr_chr13CG12230 [Ipomoea trifida]
MEETEERSERASRMARGTQWRAGNLLRRHLELHFKCQRSAKKPSRQSTKWTRGRGETRSNGDQKKGAARHPISSEISRLSRRREAAALTAATRNAPPSPKRSQRRRCPLSPVAQDSRRHQNADYAPPLSLDDVDAGRSRTGAGDRQHSPPLRRRDRRKDRNGRLNSDPDADR